MGRTQWPTTITLSYETSVPGPKRFCGKYLQPDRAAFAFGSRSTLANGGDILIDVANEDHVLRLDTEKLRVILCDGLKELLCEEY
jgi:hypothetical protein